MLGAAFAAALVQSAATSRAQSLTLASGEILRGRFTQQRFLQGFNAPLTSTGSFILAPGRGVLWHAETPFALITAMGPGGIVQRIVGGATTHYPASRLPAIVRLYEIFGAALSGDWPKLATVFDVRREGTDKAWTVTLTPMRAGNDGLPLRHVVVRGSRYGRFGRGDAHQRRLGPHRVQPAGAIARSARRRSQRVARHGQPPMTRLLAALWLAIVAAAAVYLTVLGMAGFPIRTDLLALLPREEQDPVAQLATQAVSRSLGRRIVLAFGDTDRGRARTAAQQATAAVAATGLVDPLDSAALQDAGRALATFYFPYRDALLSPADRKALEDGRGEDLSKRALAQAFGFGSPVDATLLAADPFLLLPAFLTSLPNPLGRLALDDGMLTVVDGATTWVVVPMTLRHDPFDLDVQEKLVTAIDNAVGTIAKQMPDVKVLRAGAIFFADHGARTAIDEVTMLTIIEIAGTILLIVGVFRRLSPLLLNLLALGVGIAVAFAGTFLIFGEIHVAALLFGTSLIGVAVDYGLHYCTTAFGTAAVTSRQRLAFVMPAITLGLATTLVGYAALAAAPFPGLKQIAVFAIIGLVGAFATVTLWFPLLDRLAPLRHGAPLLAIAALPWTFWTAPGNRIGRGLLVACCLAVLGFGLARYHVDDDVRRLQALSPTLLSQQDEIKRLIGATTEPQHLLVVAPDDETALQREEALIPILDRLVSERAIAGYQMSAAFVPSLSRQSADRALIKSRLVEPLLAQHVAQLGLPTAPAAG